MTLAPIGWFVVHAVWIGCLIGALAAVFVAWLDEARPQRRYLVSYISLLLMVLCPLAVVATTLDLFAPPVRVQVTSLVEETVGLSAVVEWRGRLVRGAAVIWLLGVAWRVVCVGREWRRLRRLTHGDVAKAADAEVHTLVSNVKAQLGLRSRVAVIESRLAPVPMVVGCRRATILLPPHARALQPVQIRGIVAHELAHVRRRDVAANLLQIAADSLLWFHPAARWLSARIRTEREYCCDDAALAVGTDPAAYARALGWLEEAREGLAVSSGSGTLLDRIRRVAGVPRPTLTRQRAVAALLVALAIASIVITAAMVVPPAMPLDVRLRTRTPAREGAVVSPTGLKTSAPRTPQR